MTNWPEIITAAGGCLGAAGVIGALLIVPAPTRYNNLAERVKKLEEMVEKLTYTNTFLSNGVTALSMHSDVLRERIITTDPKAQIETAEEVLEQVKRNIERLAAQRKPAREQSGD